MKFTDLPKYYNTNYSVEVSISYIKEFIENLNQDTIDTFGENYSLEMNPDFQRGHVWTKDQQVKFIEHLLMGGKSGLDIYFNASFYSNEEIQPMNSYCVDGLQRITAINKFLDNDLIIFKSIEPEGLKFNDFTDKSSIKSFRMKIHVGQFQSKTDVMRWYLQMNGGGTPHSEEELNRVRSLIRKEDIKDGKR